MTTITEALRAARACIQQDRTSLADTGMRHDNTMDPDAAAGVAEYDAVLQQIDAALAGMTHHITDEQIEQAYEAEMRQSLRPQDRATVVRVCRAVLALAAPQGEPALYVDGAALSSLSEAVQHSVVGSASLFGSIFKTARHTTPLYTAPAPAVPSGWKLVPVEPTEAMLTAGALAHKQSPAHDFEGPIHDAWSAMLTAAPTPPAQTTPEPVGGPWGWAIEDKHGVAQAIRPARKEFFGCVQSTEPFTAEDIAKMDREWVGIAPHRIVTLHTRPAEQPAVPESADDSDGLLRVIASLGAALRRLSFAAQTSGGTAGPDAELMAAIGQAQQALSLGGIGAAMFACQATPAVPEDVARVNKQMLDALEEVLPALPTWHRPKVNAAIDAARAAEKGGA